MTSPERGGLALFIVAIITIAALCLTIEDYRVENEALKAELAQLKQETRWIPATDSIRIIITLESKP